MPDHRIALRVRLLAGLALLTVALAATAGDVPVQPRHYPLTSDSLQHADVPRGQLEGPFELHSKVIPGTVRRYWIHVPANHDPARPANLLVFHDGQRATNPQGSLRVGNVLDSLVYRGDIPPTIGVFVTPGHRAAQYPDDLGMSNPDNRAQEYDALDDTYSRMLIDELLPQVAARHALSDDPARRAIGGTSSGAIAAFTVAWHRPDVFGNVISFIGSYVSIGYRPAQDGVPMVPGGDLYPGMIRKSGIRPLRIFLQDGSNDLDNEHGNWFLANQQMLAALHWANAQAERNGDSGPRYQVAHVWGEGGHSDDHGGQLLPDVLRWLWTPGAPPPAHAADGPDHPAD